MRLAAAFAALNAEGKVVFTDKEEVVVYETYNDGGEDDFFTTFTPAVLEGFRRVYVSTIKSLHNYGESRVILNMDTDEPIGKVPPYMALFGLKSTKEVVNFYLTRRFKRMNHFSDQYDVFYYAARNTQLRYSNYENMELLHLFMPEFSSKGVSYYANYRDALRDRRTQTTYGRFARKVCPELSDADVEKITDSLREQFVKRDFTLHEGSASRDFEHAYQHDQAKSLNIYTTHARKSLANSCMRDDFGYNQHPAAVYGSGDFTIYWLEDEKGKIGGRVVVYTPANKKPQAGPVYGACEHSIEMLYDKLKEIDAELYDDSSWVGARLLKIPVCDEEYLMPFLDLDAEGYDDGDYFRISHTGVEYEFCSTEGTIYTHHKETCTECGEGVHEDEVYSSEEGYYYCECCYHEHYTNCAITGNEIRRDDAVDIYTNSRAFLWGTRQYTIITVGDDQDYDSCYYTDELWWAEDMVYDADDNHVSPVYAKNNLTEVDGVWYTEDQLKAKEEEEKGEAA